MCTKKTGYVFLSCSQKIKQRLSLAGLLADHSSSRILPVFTVDTSSCPDLQLLGQLRLLRIPYYALAPIQAPSL